MHLKKILLLWPLSSFVTILVYFMSVTCCIDSKRHNSILFLLCHVHIKNTKVLLKFICFLSIILFFSSSNSFYHDRFAPKTYVLWPAVICTTLEEIPIFDSKTETHRLKSIKWNLNRKQRTENRIDTTCLTLTSKYLINKSPGSLRCVAFW